MLHRPVLAALNHLLAQSGWAQPRLSRFKGKTARLHVAPFTLACTVQANGSLLATADDACADAEITMAPTLLPRLAMQDEAAIQLIGCSGDAALIQEILFIIRHLRWDAAEDLSRITGDIAAERLVQFALAKQQQLRATALNLAQAAAEYWTEERPLVAKPAPIADFAKQMDKLQQDLRVLEQRIQRLSES